jgi:hypothetical protein
MKISVVWINIILCVAVLVSGILGAELWFRLFYPQPTYAVEYAPWGWRHIPGISFLHGAEQGREFVTKMHYNAQGLRDDREFSYAKPRGIYRVEVFGDSYVEGIEVPHEKNLCSMLERKLNMNGLSCRCEVMNFGVYAYDNAQELLYFEADGVKYNPDLVVIIYSMDDPQNYQRGFVRVENGIVVRHPFIATRVQSFARLLRGYIKAHSHLFTFVVNRISAMKSGSFVKDGKEVTLTHDLPYRISDNELEMNMKGKNWEVTAAIFKEFKSVCDTIGAEMLLVSTHIDPVKFKNQIEIRRQFCAENGIAFLVSYDFDPAGLKKFHYALDGHWNESGHAKIADLLYEHMRTRGLLCSE